MLSFLEMLRFNAAVALALAATSGLRVFDLNNRPVDPLQLSAGAKTVVFLFTATDCPISNRYAPEIRRLSQRFVPQGVVFRLIYPGRADAASAIREHVKTFSYTNVAEPYRDPELALTKFVGATVTPEAAIVANGKVVYRGRIDDRYVDLGLERPAPTIHDLADALTDLIAGRPIAHPVTQAVGCFITDLAR